MKEKIADLVARCNERIKQSATLVQLNECKTAFLGKSGELTGLLRSMKDLPAEQRPQIGSMVNQARDILEKVFEKAENFVKQSVLNATLSRERADVSLIKYADSQGTLHPVTRIANEIMDCLIPMGFEILEGPEIESDYYNFKALNIPDDHPARDMQDTFYLAQSILLRTHTSPNQVRTMEVKKPPIKMLCPGRTYRSDSDASHTPVFHQIEGLVVDENITMCDLMGTLEHIAKHLFNAETKVRFRPSYFPFTEPSVEVDLSCATCGGVGCSICKGTGWVEVVGAGMVNPCVLENCGIDSKRYSGFAFGWGLERIAMIKYGITDIRLLFENDIRLLNQFKKQ